MWKSLVNLPEDSPIEQEIGLILDSVVYENVRFYKVFFGSCGLRWVVSGIFVVIDFYDNMNLFLGRMKRAGACCN